LSVQNKIRGALRPERDSAVAEVLGAVAAT
jgi:hypothetical protein